MNKCKNCKKGVKLPIGVQCTVNFINQNPYPSGFSNGIPCQEIKTRECYADDDCCSKFERSSSGGFACGDGGIQRK